MQKTATQKGSESIHDFLHGGGHNWYANEQFEDIKKHIFYVNDQCEDIKKDIFYVYMYLDSSVLFIYLMNAFL